MTTVSVGARLHIGFRNLSTTGERVFGGIGLAIANPRVVVQVEPAPSVRCAHDRAERFAERTCRLLDLAGASVTVDQSLPSHRGFGSGTQLALAVYAAIALAHDRTPAVRRHAPALGRGRRSGVGIATFEHGGFVVDDGHPVNAAHITDPSTCNWKVPPCTTQLGVPMDWRIVLVLPEVRAGRHHEVEERSMQTVLEAADPTIAATVERVLAGDVIPAIQSGNLAQFGAGIGEIDRYNGDWFAIEQAERYRPTSGRIITILRACPSLYGVGQSSWGPLVYGLTHRNDVAAARAASERALEQTGCDGSVDVVTPRNTGYAVHNNNANNRTMRRYDGGVISE